MNRFPDIKVELLHCPINPMMVVWEVTHPFGEPPGDDAELLSNFQHVLRGEELPNIGLEFIWLVFRLSNVSTAFTHQLVRHRVGCSYLQISNRVPDTVRQYSGQVALDGLSPELQQEYSELHEASLQLHHKLLKRDKELARYALLQAKETIIHWGVNYRALYQTMRTRLCHKAAPEMREVMQEVKQELHQVHPYLADQLHAPCYGRDTCPITGGGLCRKSQ